jgi:hypothetical protein
MSETPAPPVGPTPSESNAARDILSVAADAYARARHAGRDPSQARTLAAEVVRALHPAWPETLISQVVSVIAASAADSGDAPPRDEQLPLPDPALRPADADIVTAVLAHALRFGLDGKPRRTASDFLAPIAAEQIYQHLRRAGLVIFQRPATRPHPGMG